MPCIQPRYSYIRAKIHVLIFLFHLPAAKLESWETATHLNTSRCWSSHVAQNLQKGAQMTEDQQVIAIGLGASTCSISASGFEPEPKALNIKRWSKGSFCFHKTAGASAATTASLSSELGTWSTGQGRIATPQDTDHVSCLHRTTPKPDRDESSWWLKHPVQKYAVPIDVKLDHLKLASQLLRNKKNDFNPPPPTTRWGSPTHVDRPRASTVQKAGRAVAPNEARYPPPKKKGHKHHTPGKKHV